jgi:hypothetical protein
MVASFKKFPAIHKFYWFVARGTLGGTGPRRSGKVRPVNLTGLLVGRSQRSKNEHWCAVSDILPLGGAPNGDLPKKTRGIFLRDPDPWLGRNGRDNLKRVDNRSE